MSKSGICLLKHGALIDKEKIKTDAEALMADNPGMTKEAAMTKVAQDMVAALQRQEQAELKGGEMFSFAGKNALTSNVFNLVTAHLRLKKGEDTETVRQETGWHMGADEKWRFEISDREAKIKKPFPTLGQPFGKIFEAEFKKQVDANDIKGFTVGDLLEHEQLFSAYPSLRDISVSTQPGKGASIATGSTPVAIYIGEDAPMSEVKSILLHELQHGIQSIEQFASGGSLRNIHPDNYSDYYKTNMRKLQDKAYAAQKAGDMAGALKILEMRKQLIKPAQFEAYRRLAGEVEARNTQARAQMSDDYRRMVPPSETADVKDKDVVISWNGKEMAMESTDISDAAIDDAYEFNDTVRYSVRAEAPPKKTVTAYKLFRVKKKQPGFVFPLFVNANDPTPIGEWLNADFGDNTKTKIGALAPRPGWHMGDSPASFHIGGDKKKVLDVETGEYKSKPTSRPADQVWAEVEVSADVDWQQEANRRASRYKGNSKKTGSVKGEINPSTAEIRDEIPKDGYYRYKTNPNMVGNWIIGGAIKITRLLSDDDVRALNEKLGSPNDLPRNEPFDLAAYGLDGVKFSKTLPSTITIDGKERSTLNSNGKPIAQTEEGIRNFWKWFSPSPVSLTNGLPISVISSLKRDTQDLSDLIKSKSFISKSDSGLIIPRPVLTHMVGAINNDKVIDSVIGSLPVDMVNFLERKKFSAKMVLHNVSMLEDVFTIDPKSDIPLGVNPSALAELLVRVVADAGAKITGLTNGTLERNAAMLADANNPIFGAHVNKSPTKNLSIITQFGDSKVVDGRGHPLVAYHGSDNEFNEFSKDKSVDYFWFSEDQDDAQDYGNTVTSNYLNIKNPSEFERYSGDAGLQDAINKAMSEGKDGLKVTSPEDGDDNGMYWSTNYIAFNPNQIKSATGNTGAFSAENNDIRYSVASNVRDTIESAKDIDALKGFAEGVDALSDKAKNNVYALATQRQLVDMGKQYFTSMPKYLQDRTGMNTVIEKLINKSDDITKKWEQLVEHSDVPFKDQIQKKQNKIMQKKLADVMHYATIYGQDPTKPYSGDPENLEAIANYDEVSELFSNLNGNAKAVFKLAAQDHHDHMQKAISLMKNNVEKSAASRIAKDKMLESLDNTLQESNTIYFPLSRFGDYWLYYEQDGVNYFNMFETEAQLAAFKKKNPGIDIESEGIKLQNMKSIDGVSSEFLNSVGKLTDEISDPQEKAQIQDAMYQLYLKTLPDLSARKHFIHRKKTAGFHDDALRGFASKAFHDAKMIGRLQYRESLEQHIKDMREAIKAAQSRKSRASMTDRLYLLSSLRDGDEVNPELQADLEALQEEYALRESRDTERYELIDGDIKALENVLDMADKIGGDVIKSSRILNELQLSHDAMMSPNTAGWASMLNSIGFMNFLGFSPSAALVNTLQTPTVSMPFMAAKYTLGKAAKQLNRAFKEFYSHKNADGHMSMEDGLSGNDARAFQEMHDRGILTRTRSMDLIGIGEEGINSGSMRRKLMYASAYMFNRAEVMNREITGMAAFRLAMADHGDFDRAIAYTDEVINTTHGDYTGDNRSRIMRGNGARVALQFKQYSQLMTYNWGKAALDAIGVTKKKMEGKPLTEEDKQAVRLLLFMVSAQGSAAGLMGLPIGGFMIAAQLLADMGDDDDEPFDVEAELKAFIYENFTDFANINDAIVRGPLTAWTGIDFQSRLNQSDMWMREPERELEGEYGMSYLAETFGGPIAGMVASMLDSKRMMDDGHIMRGIEKMLPKAIKDPITATRFLEDGARNMRGDLIEDINIFEAIAKAGGFNSADLSLQYDENFIKKRVDAEYKQRRSQLVDKAATAQIDGDEEAFNDAWSEIDDFNTVNPELRITKLTIYKSVKSRKATSKRMTDGVLLDKRLQSKTARFDFNADQITY